MNIRHILKVTAYTHSNAYCFAFMRKATSPLSSLRKRTLQPRVLRIEIRPLGLNIHPNNYKYIPVKKRGTSSGLISPRASGQQVFRPEDEIETFFPPRALRMRG